MLYVSHRLDEVLELADRVTVLRGGQVAAAFERGEASAEQLVSAMSGSGSGARPERFSRRPSRQTRPPSLPATFC